MYQPCLQAIRRPVTTCLLFGVLVLISNTRASSELKLVSVNKTVTMSSTLNYDGLWNASRAVDGNTNRDADACDCCSATSSSNRPWLQVDLGKRYEISKIQILGRNNTLNEDFNGLQLFLRQQSAIMGTAIKAVTSTVHVVDFTLENSVISQFVTVVLQGSSKILLVCEISVFAKELPVSVNKMVTMSSTLNYNGLWDAYKAVDGNTNTSADACHCCAATQTSNNPWLQVDLGKPYAISEVKLLGRTDGGINNFQGLHIFLQQYSASMGTALHTITEAVVVVDYILEDIPTSQFVTVVLQRSNKILLVCEISVMEDVDECSDNTDNCDANALCTNTAASFTCACNSGYTGDGVTCTDIDECTNTTENCHENATCTNTGGSYTCACNKGYSGDGMNCTDIDECTNTTDNCHENATCTNTGGSFTCACNKGYSGDGVNCTDIDECTATTDACHANTNCTNTAGSFTCACNMGYTADGVNCTDIDECTATTDACHANTNCTNTAGSFTCACSMGYTGDGVNCTDIDECTATTDACHANTNCTNTAGSFTCACNMGYTGDGVNCTDIDECTATTDACHANTYCTNTAGSFTCACNMGYTGDGVNCTDIDECTATTDACHANTNCTNTAGSFACACNMGYTGDGVNCTELLTENPTSHAATIGGVVGGIAVLLIAITGLVIFIKRRSPTSKSMFDSSILAVAPRRKTTNASPETKRNADESGNVNIAFGNDHSNEYYSFALREGDLQTHQLWSYIRIKKQNQCKALYDEFQTLTLGLQYDTNVANHPSNQGKNRYRELYAYDHSRVELKVNGDEETDYINACFINGFERDKKFIAAQGPTESMKNDFWRMVWQQKSDRIVMLTNLMEMGSVKCVKYWPDEGSLTFGSILVELLSTDSNTDFETRHFKISQDNKEQRNVSQYHFKSWPDKSVPDSAWCLVNFWRTVMDQVSSSPQAPVVVHCSAGVGRTGTFIALDNLYNQASVKGYILPLQMVETLRRQRVNMVQTKDQYVYLHEAVAEALYIGTHYVWSSQWGDIYNHLLQSTSLGSNTSRFEYQYDLILQSCAGKSNPPETEAEYANTQSLASEIDEYRPKLKDRGSKYVHALGALYLPNYSEANTYIVAKSPTDSTMEELWSLVDEQNIKAIIMFTETSSPSYKASSYMGTKSKAAQGRFDVTLVEERKDTCYIERTFTIKESDKGDETRRTVKQFEYTAWKSGDDVPAEPQSMIDLLDGVHRWQPHVSLSQPVLVHCGNGFTRCGLGCVVMNELERIRRDDGHINIVESVMLMKERHRNIIPNFKQYQFCNDVILAHVKQNDIYQNI